MIGIDRLEVDLFEGQNHRSETLTVVKHCMQTIINQREKETDSKLEGQMHLWQINSLLMHV